MYKAIVKSLADLNELTKCDGFKLPKFKEGDTALVDCVPLIFIGGKWVDLATHEAEEQSKEEAKREAEEKAKAEEEAKADKE